MHQTGLNINIKYTPKGFNVNIKYQISNNTKVYHNDITKSKLNQYNKKKSKYIDNTTQAPHQSHLPYIAIYPGQWVKFSMLSHQQNDHESSSP